MATDPTDRPIEAIEIESGVGICSKFIQVRSSVQLSGGQVVGARLAREFR